MESLPVGTVTFLFTDVEGSTRLLEDMGAARYADVLAEHRRLVREALLEHGGVEVDTQGDAFFCVFSSAREAAACAWRVQERLAAGELRVRMGLHTGEALVADGHYVGMDVHRAARIAACGHGGQVVVSSTTAALLESESFPLRDLGEHRLKDLSAPQRLYQLGEGAFPPPKTLHRTNLEFRVLGPLEVIAEGRQVALGGQKQRALLAALLLEANRVVSTSRLIDAMWEDDPPETAPKALQVYVSQLRKLLGKERVLTKAPGYELRVEPEEVDRTAFERLRKEGKPHEALSLWRGPALAELAHRRFAQAETARLEDLRLECLEQRIESDFTAGRAAELTGELEALVAEHPLRERLRAQLMLALYRAGRQADALAVYDDARRTLVEELGIDPGKPLRDLHRAILRQDPVLDDVADQPDGTDAARGPFVGREREVEVLASSLRDAVAGRGRLVLLVGEPGIGKTRLAEDLAVRARARGARVVVGRCWEAGGAPAYWPWVESLRSLLRETDAETVRGHLGARALDLAQLLPELREMLPGLGEPPPLESESARFRLFEAVASFLTAAAEDRPIVLALDDLHAADEPSLLLLRFLARQLGERRLLVVGAYRDVDPGPTAPLRAAVTELAREPVTRALVLTGLTEQDVGRFIELTTGETPSDDLVRLVHEETEGNPLFVGEIVRLQAAEGVPERVAATARLAIPQSVRDVIARRLAHLSEECNRVLVLASVLGREFALDALELVAQVSRDELLELLDEALSARVLSDVPDTPARLSFAHVLIRDTLYDGLTSARRVRLHRTALQALEALYGAETGAHLAELAYHAVAGSDFDNGVRYARQAGDHALVLLAYEEAARLYATALDALAPSDPSDEEARCELLLALAEAESRAGHSDAAKRAAFEAAEIARSLGHSRALARAAAAYAGRIVWGRAGSDTRLVPLLEEALEALGDADGDLRARLLARLAGALRDEHDRSRRDALGAEAVELARASGNEATLAYALDAHAFAILAPDTVDRLLGIGSELCAGGRRSGDRERVVAGHMLRSMAQLIAGDIAGGERDLDAAVRIAEQLGQPAQLWQVGGDRAMLALAKGRFAEAEELIAQAFALGERAQPEAAVPIHRLQRAALLGFCGGLDEIVPAIEGLVAASPARPVFRCALTEIYARLGRIEEATRELGQLVEGGVAALPFDQEWLYGMSLLAETASVLDDVEAAAVLYPLLEPWAALNAVDVAEGMRGSVARYLGLLAVTLGRWSDAERHLDDALAANERMGLRPWHARTQEDLARMVRLRGGPGDAERAEQLLAAAVSSYRELGMEIRAGAGSS
jgi:DNA-binding SARP family transcriptional activator/class 3 adenylate cyclase